MKKSKIQKIIFIIADTLRAQNVGLYGAKSSPTPNIDAFGQDGVVFTNAYCSITCTDPSISSIMTGEYPLSLGIVNHGLHVTKEEEENLSNALFLAEILKKNGYKTAAVDWLGRWHQNAYTYYSGKIMKDFNPLELTLNRVPLFFYARFLDRIGIKLAKREFFLRFYYALFPSVKIPYDPADIVIDKAITILKKNIKNPLFLYLHLWDAHMPYIRPRGLKSYLFDNVEDTYNAEIKFLDGELKRLFNFSRQFDDVLIILTSDHGENFSEHDIPLNHENLYEDVVKVPLIIKHKSIPPKKINSLVQHVDILPTILDLLDIPCPKDIDGKSLLPLILGKKKQVRNFVYFEDITYKRLKIMKNNRRRGIRIGNYKYIEKLSGSNHDLYQIILREDLTIAKEELYDLKKDPQEKKNIAKSKPLIVKRLKRKLEDIIFELNIKRLQKDLLKKSSYSYDASSLF